MMLYLISKPFDLTAGQYSCKRISLDIAEAEIKKADSVGQLRSLVHFASTVAALKSLSAIDIAIVRNTEQPNLETGDRLLSVRLRPDTPKGRSIGLNDLEFWLIEFSQGSYDAIKAYSEWPIVLH